MSATGSNQLRFAQNFWDTQYRDHVIQGSFRVPGTGTVWCNGVFGSQVRTAYNDVWVAIGSFIATTRKIQTGRKQNFTRGNFTKLCYTSWKFQEGKAENQARARKMHDMAHAEYGNSILFFLDHHSSKFYFLFIWHRNFRMLFLQ